MYSRREFVQNIRKDLQRELDPTHPYHDNKQQEAFFWGCNFSICLSISHWVLISTNCVIVRVKIIFYSESQKRLFEYFYCGFRVLTYGKDPSSMLVRLKKAILNLQ